MERAFREYLKSGLKNWIKSNAPYLKLSKIRIGSPFEGALVWQCESTTNTRIYLILQFFGNRDYVSLHLAWSNNEIVPEYAWANQTFERVRELKADGKVNDALVATILDEDCGWATGELVCGADQFEISGPVPPESRLQELFEGDATRELLRASVLEPAGISEWRKATMYHFWGLVSCYSEISASDTEFAVGGTLKNIIKAISNSYLPRIEAAKRKV